MKIPLAQTKVDEFSKNLFFASKCKSILIETDNRKEYVNKRLNDFLKRNYIRRYFQNTSKGAVSAERFNRTIGKLVKKPVFEKGSADQINEIPFITKKDNNFFHHSTKMTPMQASMKKNENTVFSNLQEKRKQTSKKIRIRTINTICRY